MTPVPPLTTAVHEPISVIKILPRWPGRKEFLNSHRMFPRKRSTTTFHSHSWPRKVACFLGDPFFICLNQPKNHPHPSIYPSLPGSFVLAINNGHQNWSPPRNAWNIPLYFVVVLFFLRPPLFIISFLWFNPIYTHSEEDNHSATLSHPNKWNNKVGGGWEGHH